MKTLRSHMKVVWLCALMGAVSTPEMALGADAPRAITLNAIVEGAKKEGKVSWGSYLDDTEVGELNKAFQKEYPFIKVDYTRLRPPYERLLLEMQAGSFPYDVIAVRPNLMNQHRELGYLIDAVDWKAVFGVDPRMVYPGGVAVSTITNPAVIVYNKNLVPKERVPKTWADCYDPYFKGKLVVLVAAGQVVTLWSAFGEQWGLDFAKKLLANNPRWVSGNTNALTRVASGEMLMVCPTSHGTWYRYVKDQPGAPVAAVFPEGPVVTDRDMILTPIKGASHPNAALLLTGWIGSKGVTFMRTGRESVFHPDSELAVQVKRMGRELKVQPWEITVEEEKYEKRILEIWGFPKPKN